MKKAIINGGIGSKVICAVTDEVTLEAAPIKGTDNGDGTASLLVTSSMAELPDTASGDLAAINSASASIDGKLPALVDGKIPVDASVSIDSVDIGDVDITEFPAGNLGQQAKAASLSVAPATDITDPTYIGDVKFGEELPAGTQIIGKVGIDQTTPGATNLVNVNGGASQTADIKVTLDSESVAVTGPLTDAQLTTQALAKESTLGSIKTAAESLAVATPDTAAGDLASMAADLGTMQTDLTTIAGAISGDKIEGETTVITPNVELLAASILTWRSYQRENVVNVPVTVVPDQILVDVANYAVSKYAICDGVDDYISLGVVGTWGQNLHKSSLTFKIKTNVTTQVMLLGNMNDGNTMRLTVYANTKNNEALDVGTTAIRVRSNNNKSCIGQINTNIYDGLWHTIKIDLSDVINGNLIIYVDGVLQTVLYSYNDIGGTYTDWQYPFVFGASNNRGTIGEFSACSVSDIAVDILEDAYARWPINEGTGTALVDSIGSNDGTLEGGVAWSADTISHAVGSTALDAYFEHLVGVEYIPWYDGEGQQISFPVPANSHAIYGPFQGFPRFSGGRIRFKATSSAALPGKNGRTSVAVQQCR